LVGGARRRAFGGPWHVDTGRPVLLDEQSPRALGEGLPDGWMKHVPVGSMEDVPDGWMANVRYSWTKDVPDGWMKNVPESWMKDVPDGWMKDSSPRWMRHCGRWAKFCPGCWTNSCSCQMDNGSLGYVDEASSNRWMKPCP